MNFNSRTKDSTLISNESGSITWKIIGKEINQFLQAKNGKSFKSDVFNIGGLNLYLEVYPNGVKPGDDDNVDLFLCAHQFPPSIHELTLRFSLFCLQSNRIFTKIKQFNKTTDCSGWPFNTLTLFELQRMNDVQCLSFQTDVKILNVEYNLNIRHNKHVIGCLIYEHEKFKMHKSSRFDWTIAQHEYQRFMGCKARQEIHSERFGAHGMFQLQCYPNGPSLSKNPGQTVLALNLLILPPMISAITVVYCFGCADTNSKLQDRAIFSYQNNTVGWTDKSLLRQRLAQVSQDSKSLMFYCKIEIQNIFDKDNQLISPHLWYKFITDDVNIDGNHVQRQQTREILHMRQEMIKLKFQMQQLQKQMAKTKTKKTNKRNHRSSSTLYTELTSNFNFNTPNSNDATRFSSKTKNVNILEDEDESKYADDYKPSLTIKQDFKPPGLSMPISLVVGVHTPRRVLEDLDDLDGLDVTNTTDKSEEPNQNMNRVFNFKDSQTGKLEKAASERMEYHNPICLNDFFGAPNVSQSKTERNILSLTGVGHKLYSSLTTTTNSQVSIENAENNNNQLPKREI